MSHPHARSKSHAHSLLVVVAIAALLLPFSHGAVAQQQAGSADLITADQLRDYLYFIASDEMEGRRAPSRGLDLTAKFIAMNLSRWGLKPAGDDGTFLQMIELERRKIDPEASFVQVGDTRFDFGSGFLASTVAGAGSGEVVYAGHGWVIPGKSIDAYEGLDVRGKVVVIGGGLPEGLTRADTSGDDVQRASEYLAAHGAAAMITVPSGRALQRWQRSVDAALSRGSTRVVGLDPTRGASVVSITASAALIEALFDGTSTSGEAVLAAASGGGPMAPFALGKPASFEVGVDIETIWTQNVVGIIEGTDPELKNEYVAIGAHYDHVGIGTPVNGDSIYNGADDDGSGTTATLAIAEAFAKGERPRRSILFVWHTGEEVGMWGSRYINENPPVPARQIVTQLNIDMIGRSKLPGDTNPANDELTGPNEVYVIGPGVQSEELGEILDEVNDGYLGLEFNSLYDTIDHSQRFFFRSDHVNYARNGIPIAFFFSGVHEDYHRPSDHADKIDYEKMLRITRTIYASAWELASRDGRPALNDVLPESIRR